MHLLLGRTTQALMPCTGTDFGLGVSQVGCELQDAMHMVCCVVMRMTWD
jgi:hypothetical protein